MIVFLVVLGILLKVASQEHWINFSSGQPAQAAQAQSGTGPAPVAASILSDAESHDSESYQWSYGHSPGSWHTGDGMDCSGLIIVSVYEATHGKVRLDGEVVSDFPNDGHWKTIPISQAQPGDILLRLTGDNNHDHVALVVANHHDGYFALFAAWTSNVAQADQVSLHPNDSGGWYSKAARFTG